MSKTPFLIITAIICSFRDLLVAFVFCLYLLIQIINLLVNSLASKPCESCQLVSENSAEDCKNNCCSDIA